MRQIQRRLQALERLPRFQHPPSPLEQIESLASKQVSDEDLELAIKLLSDLDQGVCRDSSPSESAAWAAYLAALETEAQRMGFKSFADAERHAERSQAR